MTDIYSDFKQRPQKPGGFTLVELLIVITIIGVLVALLMPAVNSAQESGRRANCMSNLKQLATANLTHEATNGYLPGGGWGWGWVGDPDRGTGLRQPGGWIYNILPYIDQSDLHDMGKSASATAKMTLFSQRASVPLPLTICPTRRRVQTFNGWQHGNPGNFNWPATLARSDYASNGGDVVLEPSSMGLWPTNCYNTDCGPTTIPSDATLAQLQAQAVACKPTGIDYPMATLSTAAIKDGCSYTYLLGEKSLCPDMYFDGMSEGDNENQYTGFNADTSRWTDGDTTPIDLPAQDRAGYDNYDAFGSAHPAGFSMAFCDGAARLMSYSIDPLTHRQLGNRMDGEPTQLQKIDANSR